ncbi:WD repeat-containing protein 78 isoform X2 [Octodon degus]|uniref:Dynein axonemal intermediate chain 4 n=1 Tax=Octodon degus TaxID=10160 RepID=A0A6P6ENW5_OCTDE|nr:WD repeat-containing protein 78 isoform X2 [Octodon degus]
MSGSSSSGRKSPMHSVFQSKKSISFTEKAKDSLKKGHAGANQSRMGVSRNLIIVPEMKMTEKVNVASTKIIQVLDKNGVDVTPRPLYCADLHAAKPNKLLSSQEGLLSSDILASYSMYQNTMNRSTMGQFTRSALGSSTVSKSSMSTTVSMAEDLEEPSYKHEKLASFTDMRVMRAAPETAITKEDLEKNIEILLTETDTLRFFDLPTVMISVESEEAEKVIHRNNKYETLCRNRAGNDLYVERMMQTFNGAPKNKDVQCDKIILEDQGVMATAWDLYDSYNALELALAAKPSAVDSSSKANALSKDRDHTLPGSATDKTSETSSLMDLESVILTKVHEDEEDHADTIMKSDKFLQDLFFMERVLMENIFQPKLAAYRQLPVLKEPEPGEPEDVLEGEKVEEVEEVKKEEEEEIEISTEQSTIPANLERLWSFSCDLTKGLNVSSLAWNKTNPDLLAVGYGHFGFKEQRRGLACCWSIKNPMWPERVYPSPYGVTAVDFSIGTPNLLAVGYYNGTIAIYNVQSSSNVPVLDSSESPQKHVGPVWQLQWIEQDRGSTGDDKREFLVSISADGRISKWVIRKGLDSHDLMRLKRTTISSNKKGDKEKKGEALISRQAPGMCFAFHPKDTNIYLVGTEEGHIHKCSCSYNEQYLETYRRHKGPVYKVTWNPFCPDTFLSCSADWGIMVWQQEHLQPFLSFYPTTHVVYDVAWSPKSSYIFAAANESRVEIWDLQMSTLDPLIVNIANPGIKFTTVLFAKHTDCLLVGDSDGQVAVYELRNMPSASDSGRGDTINALLGCKSNQPG